MKTDFTVATISNGELNVSSGVCVLYDSVAKRMTSSLVNVLLNFQIWLSRYKYNAGIDDTEYNAVNASFSVASTFPQEIPNVFTSSAIFLYVCSNS